jgi:ubiquinone/menaquinone biosynthesis C-methylase UbiE
MRNENDLKQIVKEKYGQIAKAADIKSSCGCGCSSKSDYSIMADDYFGLDGYIAEADLNLGCGLPTQFAGIKEGDTVIDLGSGAGNDVFVARSLVGETGKVIGLDMTPEMIAKAEKNNSKLGYKNVEFVFGEIENIPLPEQTADVVVSNCVLNLVPNKEKSFSEIFRILKPGGHFCISDIVINGSLPEKLKRSAELYAGCVAGASSKDEYLGIVENAGFRNVEIKKEKTIHLPDNLLRAFLTDEEVKQYDQNNAMIVSITMVGYKD